MANIYASETPEQEVVITYETALQMALRDILPVRGADAVIREIENQRDDLRDHISSIERNELTPQLQDLLHDLNMELWELDMQIWGARASQDELQQMGELALQTFVDILTTTGQADGQVLQEAIQSMVTAQNIGSNLPMMQAGRRQVWDAIDEINRLSRPYQYVMDGNRRYLSEMERQMQSLRLQQEHDRLAIENSLRNAMVALNELILAVEIAESGLALAEESLRHMYVMHELGMISTMDLLTARQQLTTHRTELSELRIHKTGARQHLNHMLGAPINQNTIIVFERETPQLPTNLNRHVSQVVAQTQAVRQLQLNIYSARYALRNFTEAREREISRNQGEGRQGETNHTRIENDRIRDALRENYNIAIASHAQAIQALDAAMLHGYNELTRLINRYEMQTATITFAETHLEIARTNYGLGRITQHELEQARFNVLMAEQAMESTLNLKWLLAFTLDNPSLLFLV